MKYDELVKRLIGWDEASKSNSTALEREAADAITTLQAELDQCRKDAERYAWIRNTPATHVPISKSELRTWMWSRPYGAGEKFDAAIDKAMESATCK